MLLVIIRKCYENKKQDRNCGKYHNAQYRKRKQRNVELFFNIRMQILFEGIDMLHFVKHGSVSNIIVRGDKDETVNKLKNMKPVLLDVLPLTLEEVFTYEMEALGYSFQDVLEVE